MEQELFNKYLYNYIHLLSAYLNDSKLGDKSIDDKELSFYIKLSKFHSLSALLYKAIVDTGVKVNKQYLGKLEQAYLYNVRKSVSFDKEREELYKYLNDNKIDYLPLKGIIIKEYYKDPMSREFADNDILFDDSKKEIVKQFFVDRGYEIVLYNRTNHDEYIKKPFYNFEMHRGLVDNNYENIDIFLKYYDNYLMHCPIKNNCEHYQSKEEFYIYFTIHSYKHYRTGGCGLRTLVDYYLYLKNNELDFGFINIELDKLWLVNFSNLISSLSIKLFDNKELNEEEKKMLLFIASSGTYGTIGNRVDTGVNKKGKMRYFLSRVFPPVATYKYRYPWAYKHHILVPIAWLLRSLRVIFTKHSLINQELKEIKKHK